MSERTSTRPQHWVFAAVALFSGCGEDLPEVVAVGDRVRIAPIEPVPVCAGSVQTFERYVAEVEERLGIERPGPVTFYWSGTAHSQFCSGPEALACAMPEERWIATQLRSAPHELVHHVAFADGGESTLLLEEGVAVYVTGDCAELVDRPERPTESLAELIGEESTMTHYAVGASLVGFISEHWGFDAVVVLRARLGERSTVEDVHSAVLEILGISLDALNALWSEAAPHRSCGPAFPLTGRAPHVLDTEPLVIASSLDCDSPTTEGPLDDGLLRGLALEQVPLRPGMYSHHELLVPIATEVELELSGPAHTAAYLRSTACWDPQLNVDLDFVIDVGPDALVSRRLGGCRWQVFLVSDDPDAPVDLALTIRPRLP